MHTHFTTTTTTTTTSTSPSIPSLLLLLTFTYPAAFPELLQVTMGPTNWGGSTHYSEDRYSEDRYSDTRLPVYTERVRGLGLRSFGILVSEKQSSELRYVPLQLYGNG